MRANTLTSATRYARKSTRDTILHTVNSIKDRQARAIAQEIREERLCNNNDGLLLF